MRFGLKFKISILVTLIIVVIMSASAYVYGFRHEKRVLDEMWLRAGEIARTIASSSLVQNPGGQAIRWDLTRNFVDTVPQSDPNLLYIVVLDREGQMQASSVNHPLLQSLTGHQEASEVSRKLKEEVRQALLTSYPKQGVPVQSKKGGDADTSNTILGSVGHRLRLEMPLTPTGGQSMGIVGIGFSLRDMDRQIIWARLFGAGLTLVFVTVGIVASVLLAHSLTRPIHALVQGMERVKAGDLTAEVKETSRDEVGMLTQAFNFMTAGLRERERVKQTFKKYVSKDVAEKILSASEEVVLTGERRAVTVLFADIRGFTGLAEKMEPEDVVGMLNEHFTLMIEIIFKHKGTLDKFIGDALMAVFGAPLSHGDDAYRAVQAAIEMQQASRELNQRRTSRGQPPLAMGVGVATGSVVSGNIGSEQRTEFTVIGDAVNTASRIQGKTAGGQILISQATYEETKDRIKVEAREPLQVKGKSEPVSVYEVICT